MRTYSIMLQTFWTGYTGRQIRELGRDAQVLAAYVCFNRHDNLIGLYYLPISYIVEDVGGSPASIERALEALAGLAAPEGASTGGRRGVDGVLAGGTGSFLHYDARSSFVWVVEMARRQLALKPGERLAVPTDGKRKQDGRIEAVRKAYAALGDNPFLGPFFDYYEDALALNSRREGRTAASWFDGASTGRRGGVKGASTGRRRVLDSDPAPDPGNSSDLLSRSVEREAAAEEPAAARGDELVGTFFRWFCNAFPEHNAGARYSITAKTDVPIVRRMLRTWSVDDLKRLALALWSDRSDPFIQSSDRGIKVLSVKASFLDARSRPSAPASNIWRSVLAKAETALSRHDFGTWFAPTSLLEDVDDVIRVRVPKAAIGQWLERHHSGRILTYLVDLGRPDARVEYVADEELAG